MTTSHDRHSKLRCPQCERATARPERIESSSADQLVLSVRCRECRHAWVVEIDGPPVMFLPRRDRRDRGGPAS